MGKRLYVGNLPYKITTQELENIFKQAGTVEKVDIIIDRQTNRSKGFGFVEMSTDEEARKAIEMLNQKDVQGRNIKVNEAKARETGNRPQDRE